MPMFTHYMSWLRALCISILRILWYPFYYFIHCAQNQRTGASATANEWNNIQMEFRLMENGIKVKVIHTFYCCIYSGHSILTRFEMLLIETFWTNWLFYEMRMLFVAEIAKDASISVSQASKFTFKLEENSFRLKYFPRTLQPLK